MFRTFCTETNLLYHQRKVFEIRYKVIYRNSEENIKLQMSQVGYNNKLCYAYTY